MSPTCTRLLKIAKESWRRSTTNFVSSAKTLNHPSSVPRSRFLHSQGSSFEQKSLNTFKDLAPRFFSGIPLEYAVAAMLPAWIGAGMLISYADSDEVAPKSLPPESPQSHIDLKEAARKERLRLESLLRSKGLSYGSYPRFTVAVKGQKTTIRFQVPLTCDLPRLIANLVSNLGLEIKEQSGASAMVIRAWDSTVAWQMTLSHPEGQKKSGEKEVHDADTTQQSGDLTVLIFRSLITSDKPEIEFMKCGSFSTSELEALVSVLQLANQKSQEIKSVETRPGVNSGPMQSNKSIADLEAMGVKVFGIDEPGTGRTNGEISWDTIAGYDEQKREIEDTVLLALKSPEVYDGIARGTRRKFETNRPRAVLFEGPPGTGKTSCARVIANQAGVPLLYVPLEVVVSKYYGESERLLGKVFTLANELSDGAIIFLDEVDSFAISRDSEMHEATRRLLSVILRQIDGFEQDKKVVVIAATNRKQDLDPALISRFDSMITFGLPDYQNRQEIAAQYAKHLSKTELADFASSTEGMSGRDIRDVCQQAERRWASKVIRAQDPKGAKEGSLPPLDEYIRSAESRKKSLLGIEELRNQNLGSSRDGRRLAFS
ncbi:Proteasome-activating nucleotidase-like protein [Drosera capensis]